MKQCKKKMSWLEKASFRGKCAKAKAVHKKGRLKKMASVILGTCRTMTHEITENIGSMNNLCPK